MTIDYGCSVRRYNEAGLAITVSSEKKTYWALFVTHRAMPVNTM
jgi:hypothetical protein